MLSISNNISIPAIKQEPGSSSFRIDHSFYYDAINKYFLIPSTVMNPIISGSNKTWTLSMDFFALTGGVFQYILSDFSLDVSFRIDSSNRIQAILRDSSFKTALSSPITLNAWQRLNIVYDYQQPLGSRVKIYLGSVDSTVSDTTTTNIDLSTTDFRLGSRGVGLGFDGYIGGVSLLDIPLTPAQVTDFNNGSNAKNPHTEFGSNCVWFANPNNSGDTAQFTITDSINSIDVTSVNMIDSDKTTNTPYI